MSEWKPIDTAPKDGTWILALAANAYAPPDATFWERYKPTAMRWLDPPGHDGLAGWAPSFIRDDDLSALNNNESDLIGWVPLPPVEIEALLAARPDGRE